VGAAALIALAATAIIAWLVATPLLSRRRRRAAMARPLDPALVAHERRNVPLRARLPGPLAARHDALVAAFLAEKRYEGCGGLEVTDEMRVTVAALACLLVLGRRGHYDGLHSVLLYPSAFWVEDEFEDEAGVVQRRRRDLSGEAWESSRVILSWDDVLESARHPGEGYNVVLHEFAHYLEAEGLGPAAAPAAQGGAQDDGRLPDARPRRHAAWAADLEREFLRFAAAVERGGEPFLDPYAAEDSAEFFAVATEDYFERAVAFRRACPGVHALLREFYAVDPSDW
jgi:Mlc titration factor MtfA (ptsG expression regulator)